MKHLLSIQSLAEKDVENILQLGSQLKSLRGKKGHPTPLQGKTWALIFSKSSTRTRVSFEVGIRELGGRAIFLGVDDIQLGRGESAEDTARVLSRYVHGIAIRTFAQSEVEAFAQMGSIPIINALTDDEHPCQILADLLTWAEKIRKKSKVRSKNICSLFRGKTVAFFGDAACNVARSWIYAAVKLKFHLRLAAPAEYQIPHALKKSLTPPYIQCFQDPEKAAEKADLLYTDTWISMGKESEEHERLSLLKPYQINDSIVRSASKDVEVMHCLPAYRDKEITSRVFDQFASTIFDEAENRLHVQKAVLSLLSRE